MRERPGVLRRAGSAVLGSAAGAVVLTLGLPVTTGASRPVRPADASAAPFAWARQRAAPSSWSRATTPGDGSILAFPPSFSVIAGDPGTISAAKTSPAGSYLAYLNVTPRQGGETLANFGDFRVRHLADEGDQRVRKVAAATRLTLGNAVGSCVIDQYVTAGSAHQYREIACLVQRHRHADVVVAAGLSKSFGQYDTIFHRSLDSLSFR